MRIAVYYDYLCPYVYRAGLWLNELVQQGTRLEVDWRYFSLTQINNKEEGWQVWEEARRHPEGWQGQRRMRGLRAQWAAEAARQQGQDAFHRYHVALLRAIHEDQRELDSDAATRHAAEHAGLDLDQWARDAQDPTLLDVLQENHQSAIAQGIFGTPTFVFQGARPAYLKLAEVPSREEALSYWDSFRSLVTEQPLFLEIKRPH